MPRAKQPTPAPILAIIEAWRRQPSADGTLHIPSHEIKLSRFPEECLDLPGLKRIVLRGHALTELPDSITVLATNAVVLDIRRNPIRRVPTLPLPPLVIDTLQHRHLATSLPESAIHGLQVLDRHWDGYRGRLGEFPRLRELSLSSVGLDTLPPEIAQLSALTSLDLSSNQLDALPPEFARLSALTSLDLSRNQLASLPPEIFSLFALNSLSLSGNQLAALPPEISNLSALASLDLSKNHLFALPWTFPQLNTLSELNLSVNPLYSLPQAITKLRALTTLDLHRTSISSLGPNIAEITSLTKLDLSDNRLPSLNSEIGRLAALTSLNLGNNWLSSVPPGIAQLKALKSLDISKNGLTSFPSLVLQLPALTTLDISGNPLCSLPSSIGKLSSLTQLNLSNNNLSFIPPEITKISRLSSLNLSYNKITSLPPEITKLRNLTSLNLWKNPFTNIPTELGKLPELSSLYLGENLLTAIPPQIAQIRSLAVLSLSGNNINTLPPEIARLSSLATLRIDNNTFDTFPTEIIKIPTLSTLNLNANNLTSLPPDISKLANLSSLYLYGNQITNLPEKITDAQSLCTIYMPGNPLSELPPELAKLDYLYDFVIDPTLLETSKREAYSAGLDALQSHLRRELDSRDAEAQAIQAKVILLGHGAAGKTTLLRRLLNPKHKVRRDDPSTHGINIEDWSIERAGDKPDILAHVWDFGGQELQYATHQFFLTEKALYVLVVNLRTHARAPHEEIFQIIRLLGGQGARVQLVLNVWGDCHEEFPLSEYRGQFPDLDIQIKPLKANLGKEDTTLRLGLESQVRAIADHLDSPLPQWVAVQRELHALRATRDHIDRQTLADICARHQLTEATDPEVLAGYLTRIGSIMAFPQAGREESQLRDFIMLNPQWALEAIYLVLKDDRVRKANGRLEEDFFIATLTADGYRQDEAEKLLTLLLKNAFEICYPLLGTKRGTYIVPQLLPTARKTHDLGSGPFLTLVYRYPQSPPRGLAARLIVRLHTAIARDHADEELVWRNGVYLRQDNAQAEVIRMTDPKRGGDILRIRVAGPSPANRDLLNRIVTELDHVHADFPHLDVQPQIGCNCGACRKAEMPHLYFKEDVQAAAATRRPLLCTASHADVPWEQLLLGIDPKLGEGVKPLVPGPRELMAISEGVHATLGARTDSGLAKLFVEFMQSTRMPNIHITNNAISNPVQNNSQTVAIDIQVAITQSNDFRDVARQLHEDLEDEGADAEALADLEKRLARVDQAIAELQQARTPDEMASQRGPMQRLKRFVENLADANDTVGKAIKTAKTSGKLLGELAGLYNDLGPLAGLPKIPFPSAEKQGES
ncbi:MAG: leucine-rich repeat domain-containing protein [Gammaproteobacteria bacterium]|nr:leucine-rich repeat domain-containing protein [Gammaproteobacteria bacterium]